MGKSGIINSPILEVVNAQVFYLPAKNPILLLDSPVELTALNLRPCAATLRIGQLNSTGDFLFPPKKQTGQVREHLTPALTKRKVYAI